MDSQVEINKLIHDIRTLQDENLALKLRSQSEAIQLMFEQFHL